MFDFTGDGGALLVLYIKLIAFSIFTLGIYSFWGRTEIRRYLWQNIRFAGQNFDYHGTGKELFLGWLKLIGLFIGIFIVLGLIAMVGGREMGPVVGLLYILALGALAPIAIHGAIRYRWSRTSWQGRRFSYQGDLVKLATILIPGLFLTAITLSIYLPFFLTNLRRYITDNTWYAGQQFRFDGDGKDLLWPYLKMLLLIIPTIGIYRFWFEAKMANYNWTRTQFAGVPFRSTLQGGDLLILTITNVLLTFFTLGIGMPWAVCRTLRFLTENLQLEQLPRVQLLAQPADAASAFGDTLGDALGTGAGLDAGFGL
jgi:uncharacterized membrane protein YjgN (DUF898 family)